MITNLVDEKINDDFLNLFSNRKIPKSKDSLFGSSLELYDLMEKTFSSIRDISVNDVVTGKIYSFSNKEILVDIGYKDYIYVNRPKKSGISNEIEVGDEIEVLITEVNDNPFIIKGSITELIKQNVHSKMKHYFENDIPLTASVESLIPAGYMMNIHMDNITVEAFMPNTLADVNKLSDSQSILGQTFEVMLETLQQEKGVYVVSRRKYLQTLIPEETRKLKYDTIYKGNVTGTTPFGVFVQFAASEKDPNCLTGMIHKVNINPEWHNKWDLIKPGMEIDFYVKEIVKGNKVILTQIIKESLWDSIKVGKILNGKIKDIKSFGALVALDEETIGLIQTTYINKYPKKINIDDEVKVKIISLIKDDRKIYLNFADRKIDEE